MKPTHTLCEMLQEVPQWLLESQQQHFISTVRDWQEFALHCYFKRHWDQAPRKKLCVCVCVCVCVCKDHVYRRLSDMHIKTHWYNTFCEAHHLKADGRIVCSMHILFDNKHLQEKTRLPCHPKNCGSYKIDLLFVFHKTHGMPSRKSGVEVHPKTMLLGTYRQY